MTVQTLLRSVTGQTLSANEQIRQLCIPDAAQHTGKLLTVGDLLYHSIIDPDERAVQSLLWRPGIAFGELVIERRFGRWINCAFHRRTLGLDVLALALEDVLAERGYADCHVVKNNEFHRLEVRVAEGAHEQYQGVRSSGEDHGVPFTNRWVLLTADVAEQGCRFAVYSAQGMDVVVDLVRRLGGFVDLSPHAYEECAFPAALAVRSHTFWRDPASRKMYVETMFNPDIAPHCWEQGGACFETQEGKWKVLVLGGYQCPTVILNGRRLRPIILSQPTAHMLAARAQFRRWFGSRCGVAGCYRPAAFRLLAPCGATDGLAISFARYVCDGPEHISALQRALGGAQCTKEQ